MNLYFAHKETELVIEFPPSVVLMTDNRMYRRYAACTVDSCEADTLEVLA